MLKRGGPKRCLEHGTVTNAETIHETLTVPDFIISICAGNRSE